MAIEHFTVEYHGEALVEHRIDVKDLAPSLLALADAMIVAHDLLVDRLAPAPSLEVTAHRGGSFDVDLILRTYEAAEDLLTSDPATALASLATLLTPVVGAFVWLRKRARSGQGEEQQVLQPGHLRVRWPDGTHLDTTTDVAALVESLDFRHNARGFVAPVAGGDVERIDVVPPAELGPRIDFDKGDLRGFDTPRGQEEPLTVSDREVVLDLLNVGLADNHKWRVSSGGAVFWVSMDDVTFVINMDRGTERFGKHDRIRCIMRETQTELPSGRLTAERSIIRVLEHRRAPVEGQLPFD